METADAGRHRGNPAMFSYLMLPHRISRRSQPLRVFRRSRSLPRGTTLDGGSGRQNETVADDPEGTSSRPPAAPSTAGAGNRSRTIRSSTWRRNGSAGVVLDELMRRPGLT